VREVREETGLDVVPGPLIGAVDRPRPGGQVLVIRDYAATVAGGALAAGDDANDARWFGARDLASLSLSTGLEEALNEWGVLGRLPSPALTGEATGGGGVIGLAVPGRDKPFPAWHLWRDPPGAAYLVTGPGEQPLPGLAGAGRVTVTVPSKDTGGAPGTWTAGVHPVEPRAAEGAAGIRPLSAGPRHPDPAPPLGARVPAATPPPRPP